jgi:hypothetical protein
MSGQAVTVGLDPGNRALKNPLATRLAQRTRLQGGVLLRL